MITVIALIILLACILFVKSTVIISKRWEECKRNTKVNVLICLLACALTFIPYVKWAIMLAAPIVVIFWYSTDGFDDSNSQVVKISKDTIIGKILLFKI